jgi:hypothetical protein
MYFQTLFFLLIMAIRSSSEKTAASETGVDSSAVEPSEKFPADSP